MKLVPRASTTFLLGSLYAAELNTRPPQRFFSRHAIAQQILRERLDVKAQLRIHLAFHPRAPQQRAHPRPHLAPQPHTSFLHLDKQLVPENPRTLAHKLPLIRTSTPPSDPRASPAAREASPQRAPPQ